jgi:hypothetical protein
VGDATRDLAVAGLAHDGRWCAVPIPGSSTSRQIVPFLLIAVPQHYDGGDSTNGILMQDFLSRRGPASCWLLVVATALVGCRSAARQPVQAPNVSVQVEHFSGTPISGPVAQAPPEPGPADALALRVSFIAMTTMPVGNMESIGAHARLITVTQGDMPVLPATRLTNQTQVAMNEDGAAKLVEQIHARHFGPAAEIRSIVTAAPPGTTAALSISSGARRLAVELSQPAKTAPPASASATTRAIDKYLRVALVMEDQSPLRELVLLEDLTIEQPRRLLLATPFQFDGVSPAWAVAIIIEASHGSDDAAHVEALAQAMEQVRASVAQASDRPQIGPIESDEWAGHRSAIEQLSRPGNRRAAMIFLADRTGAPICSDVALSADDALLAALATKIAERLKSPSDSPGLLLDLCALELLAQLGNDNKLPQEMNSVLVLHCGEAGRHVSSMEEATRGVATRQDLTNRLVAENLIYLEDNSPAARVRAFDWLQAMRRGPAGFDPLGSNQQRREAIEKALTVPTSNPAQGGAK